MKKTESVGFSAPKVALKKTSQFMDSKYRRDLSMLDFSANQAPHKRKDVMVVTPNLPYKSWRGFLFKNQDIRYFLITPGDYRKWGDLRPAHSGTAKKPYIFRYYDPKSAQPYDAPHPAKRKAQGKEAVLERFNFKEVSHFTMHGLTFRGKATEIDGKYGGAYNIFGNKSNHNTLDFCLIEQVIVGNGVRISNSSNNTVQRCVIRDKIEGFRGDNIGITVSASKGKKSQNNHIVDNEIYNMTDGVQLLYQVEMGKNIPLTGEVPGTVIDNNDLYITPKLYRQKNGQELGCAEDGIDIKVGTNSTRPEDKVLVTNNRIWGHRKTDNSCSGDSHGSGIVIHRNSKNVLVENNVIFDIARGINIAYGYAKYNEKVSDIVIRNNILYDIKEKANSAGSAMVLGADILVEYNTMKDTRYYLNIEVKRNATFRKNLIIGCEQNLLKHHRLNSTIVDNHWMVRKMGKHTANAGTANRVSTLERGKKDLKDYTFYIKRWTVPKRVLIKEVLF